MKHRFYELPLLVQWGVAVLLVGATLGGFGALVVVVAELSVAAFGRLEGALATTAFLGAVLVLAFPVLQATTTPLCTLVGLYRYRSPFLLTMRGLGGRLELHAATWFDYAFLFRPGDAGPVVKRRVQIGLLDGLIALADEAEAGTLDPAQEIIGTSWFFDSGTLERFGFRPHAPPLFNRLVLLLAIVDVSLLRSLAEGRLTLAPVWRARAAVTTAGSLSEHRAELVALRDRLRRRLEG